MGGKAEGEQYDSDEAQRRFEKLVRTALNTPPKPMKNVPRKKAPPKAREPGADGAERQR